MKKQILAVPEGVRYLSQWPDLMDLLPHGQHFILNKRVCGCGATDMFLTSPSLKVILAAPRRTLLYNKYSQHPSGTHLYRFLDEKQYFESRSSKPSELMAFNDNLWHYLNSGGRKVLTTYDSLPKLTEQLQKHGDHLSDWIVIVDELQAIYYDVVMKSSVELDFMQALSQFPSVIFLSATPYLEKYLDQTPQFKDIPMVELSWPAEITREPAIELIDIHHRPIIDVCCEIIENYRQGQGRSQILPDGSIFQSHEAVLYLNHVDLICKVIQKAGLKPDEVSVICSSKPENIRKLERLSSRTGEKYTITKNIPKRGEPRPMFTIATACTYIGSDFYSDNAYSYVFASPSVESLAVDVATDIQQIAGRQRLDYPFANALTLYYSTKASSMTEEELEANILRKNTETENAIANFEAAPHKTTQLGMLEKAIAKNAHRDNYCCISKDASGNTCVVRNPLLEIAERRAWEITNDIYRSDFSLYRTLSSSGAGVSMKADSDREEIQRLFQEWVRDGNFSRKMKLYADMFEDIPDLLESCSFVEKKYHDYYFALGRDGLEALQWREDYIKKAVRPGPESPFDEKPTSEIAKRLIEELREGQDYTKNDVKGILKEIYSDLGIPGKPSASDIGDYMTVSEKSKRVGAKVSTVLHVESPYRKEVSLFRTITDVCRPFDYNIDVVLKMVASGIDYDLARKTSVVRAATDKDEQGRRKLELPAVCFNGSFKGKNQNLIQKYSSFTALDFDHIATKERMKELREWLKGFPCVYAFFVSPSGNGVKAIILHDNYNPCLHEDLYQNLLDFFACPELDRKPSDLARGNYLSYDPKLWRNPNPEPFHYVPSPSIAKNGEGRATETVIRSTDGSDAILQDDDYVSRFLLRLSQQAISDENVLNILRARWSGASLVNGRNNTAFCYLGILCKAGISRSQAESFVGELIPDLPAEEISHAADYSYTHNLFGCERKSFRSKRNATNN